MKTIKILTYIVFALFLGLATSSCGSDGAEGAVGPAGTDGIDGNANVISSEWFDPTWVIPSANAAFTHAAPEITQEVFDTGVVMVYLRFSNNIYPMPISFPSDSTPKTYNFWAKLGEVRIWFDAESSINPSGIKFRYIIIPGSTTGKEVSSKQKIKNELETAGVDINDYYAVMDYYGLDAE